MLAAGIPPAPPVFARLTCLLSALVPLLADASAWHLVNPELQRLDARIAVADERLRKLAPMPSLYPQEQAGFHSGFARTADTVRWVQVDLGAEFPLDAVVIVPAMLGTTDAYGFPPRFRIDVSNDPLFADSITLLDHTGEVAATAAVLPWSVPARGIGARYIRFTATRLATPSALNGHHMFCLAELLAFSGGRNVALRSTVTAPSAAETLPTWSPRHLVDGGTPLGLPVLPDKQPDNGWHSGVAMRPDEAKWVQVDLGAAWPLQEIRLIPAHPGDYPDRFGFGFPRRFKIETSEHSDLTAPTTIFDATAEDFVNPGDNAVAFPVAGLTARVIRVTATKLWERSGDFVFALAELEAFAEGANVARGSGVTCSDETTTPRWSPERLVDGRASSGELLPEASWLAQLSERREIENARLALNRQREAALATAHARAAWAGVTAGGVLALALLLAWHHARRSRRQEIAALRARISRDLHDEIGSHLGSIRLMSEMALSDSTPQMAHQTLEEIHRLAREAAESMRGIIWLVREGTAPTLERLIDVLRQTAASLLRGIDHQFEVAEGRAGMTASLEFHRQVLLFFREAAHNIARHATANRVEVQVLWTETEFHLSIKDNGCGFDPTSAPSGSGLANLRQRASLLNGAVTITSTPNHGATVSLEVPLS